MKIAIGGSLESSDCLITVKPHNTTEIEIDSIVFKQFGDQIKTVILNTLKEFNVENVKIICQDKGALDYTIRARLITALKRSEAI